MPPSSPSASDVGPPLIKRRRLGAQQPARAAHDALAASLRRTEAADAPLDAQHGREDPVPSSEHEEEGDERGRSPSPRRATRSSFGSNTTAATGYRSSSAGRDAAGPPPSSPLTSLPSRSSSPVPRSSSLPPLPHLDEDAFSLSVRAAPRREDSPDHLFISLYRETSPDDPPAEIASFRFRLPPTWLESHGSAKACALLIREYKDELVGAAFRRCKPLDDDTFNAEVFGELVSDTVPALPETDYEPLPERLTLSWHFNVVAGDAHTVEARTSLQLKTEDGTITLDICLADVVLDPDDVVTLDELTEANWLVEMKGRRVGDGSGGNQAPSNPPPGYSDESLLATPHARILCEAIAQQDDVDPKRWLSSRIKRSSAAVNSRRRVPVTVMVERGVLTSAGRFIVALYGVDVHDRNNTTLHFPDKETAENAADVLRRALAELDSFSSDAAKEVWDAFVENVLATEYDRSAADGASVINGARRYFAKVMPVLVCPRDGTCSNEQHYCKSDLHPTQAGISVASSRRIGCDDVANNRECWSCALGTWLRSRRSDAKWTSSIAGYSRQDERARERSGARRVRTALTEDEARSLPAGYFPSLPKKDDLSVDVERSDLHSSILRQASDVTAVEQDPAFFYDARVDPRDRIAPFPGLASSTATTLAGFIDRQAAERESVDLRFQAFVEPSGKPNPYAHHEPSVCFIEPSWYNFAKGGGFGVVTNLTISAAYCRQLRSLQLNNRNGESLSTVLTKWLSYLALEHRQSYCRTTTQASRQLDLANRLSSVDDFFAGRAASADATEHLEEQFAGVLRSTTIVTAPPIDDALSRYGPRSSEPDDLEELLLPIHINNFMNVYRNLKEIFPATRFRENLSGFPIAFWSLETSTSDVLRMALRALARAEDECEYESHIHDEYNSAFGVLFVWLLHLAQYGDKDVFTDLTIDFSFLSPHHPLSPTLIAHRAHDIPFSFGWKTRFPSSLAQFDICRVNARVELKAVNFLVRSWRIGTIEGILASAGPVVKQVLARLGCASVEFPSPSNFRMANTVFDEYALTGLSYGEKHAFIARLDAGTASFPVPPVLRHLVGAGET
ncbi:hypothetical protein JCM11251_004811 [Rhodosporidiobolus azoricus]